MLNEDEDCFHHFVFCFLNVSPQRIMPNHGETDAKIQQFEYYNILYNSQQRPLLPNLRS